jgi:tetratricopeptide (TPR) repeat protein
MIFDNNSFKSLFSVISDKYKLLILVFFTVNLIFSQDEIPSSKDSSADRIYNHALKLKFKSPDSAVLLFDNSFKKFIKINDTVKATKSLLEKAMVFENNAKYASSYDALWKALLLNDKNGDNIKAVIYNRLGRIYSYYKREEESITYLKKSLEFQKRIIKGGKLNKSELVPYYYAIAKTFRELEHKELATVYLDSCYLFISKKNSISPIKYHLEFEKAILLSHNNKNMDAIKIMESIYPWFQKNEPSYLVLFYQYLGDMYKSSSKLSKSEELYRKALDVSENFKSHIDFTPLVYEALADLYIKKNDYKNAFVSISKAKELDAKFFDSRSSINSSLLEIKDSYRVEKERQEKQIQEQYLKQLEQEDRINNLQLIILLGSILFLLIMGYFFIKNLRAKHNVEKELMRRKNELEVQKTKELLELKNKELASSALQLIEKDEFLKNIKAIVRGKDDKLKINEINKSLRSISVSNNQNWEEFKIRFIDVNKDFYDKIFKKYPKLSQSDHKTCALIKLNFSSKEMSRLLGISVESVHTSRHRIRKKMDLPRNINLEDYINSL